MLFLFLNEIITWLIGAGGRNCSNIFVCLVQCLYRGFPKAAKMQCALREKTFVLFADADEIIFSISLNLATKVPCVIFTNWI